MVTWNKTSGKPCSSGLPWWLLLTHPAVLWEVPHLQERQKPQRCVLAQLTLLTEWHLGCDCWWGWVWAKAPAMTEVRFPSCQSWLGLCQKNRAGFWGWEISPPQSKISWNWFVKALMRHLKAFLLLSYCRKQSQFRGTPLKLHSYQCGIKNTLKCWHHGSSILCSGRFLGSFP